MKRGYQVKSLNQKSQWSPPNYVSATKEKYTVTETIETILLGDFDLPGINWKTLSGTYLYENGF